MRSAMLLAGFLAFSCYAFSQAARKQEAIPVTPPQSGEEMYTAYCASCHGRDAKGAGPAAPALKKAPPDLTHLSKNNGGKFPSARVSEVIRQGTGTPAHGSSDMPVWGDLFLALDQHDDLVVRQRVLNLTRYIRSLQHK